MDSNFAKLMRLVQELDTNKTEEEQFDTSITDDTSSEDYSNEVLNNDISDIEPLNLEELDIENDIELELVDVDDTQTAENKNTTNVLCWRDTINFINTTKNLSEFLAEVLYNTEKWIGSIQNYEDYSSNGLYHILGITATDGLIVTLEYVNLDNEIIYVTVTLSDNGVKVAKVEK